MNARLQRHIPPQDFAHWRKPHFDCRQLQALSLARPKNPPERQALFPPPYHGELYKGRHFLTKEF